MDIIFKICYNCKKITTYKGGNIMPVFLELTGKRFGRLTVMGVSEKRISGKRERYYWDCKCDCGKHRNVRTDCLTQGLVKSCGCMKKEQDKINLVKNHRHKLSGTRIYQEWVGMKQRCTNPNNNRYSDYGGRGIKVCDDWLKEPDKFFEWALNNGYNDNLTLDRIDVNGNYEPSNCRWVDIKTQCRNRRSNIYVYYNGEKITLIELSEKTGISYSALSSRYHKGDRNERLTRPLKKSTPR